METIFHKNWIVQLGEQPEKKKTDKDIRNHLSKNPAEKKTLQIVSEYIYAKEIAHQKPFWNWEESWEKALICIATVTKCNIQ